MRKWLLLAVTATSLMWVSPVSATIGNATHPPQDRAAHTPRQSAPITVVPSAGLPQRVHVDRSNANLAVARYQGRYFLVFRTAKWQIADDNTRLYVVSSRDQVHWRYEGMFHYGRDLREPRFLVWHRHLFLYFALLGNNAAAFQPGGELVTRYRDVGKWTKPVKTMPQPDFIAWAFKTRGGRAYMTGYNGGGGTFTPNPPPKREFWMTSRDAVHWRPVHPHKPIVYVGQCGEVDFAFLPNGGLVTACQTEEVDQLGWGAKVCTAPAQATWKWTCRGDPRRLDSPYVFVDRGHAYVIARRQVAFGGDYDWLGFNLPQTDVQFAAYDGSYAATTKRCSLWRINTRTRDFAPLVDLPGTGDTCYPEVIPQGHHRYLVYNYTSPLTSDPPWGTALLTGKTLIYRQTLIFPPVRSRQETARADQTTMSIDLDHPGTRLPADYVGLSLEANLLHERWMGPAQSNFLALLANLRPSSLRIGGDSVDSSAWLPSASSPRPSWATAVIRPVDLARLGRLARAAGWRVDLGVNLAHPDPAAAASEVRSAVSEIGRPLHSVEIGNEPDAYIYNPPKAPYLYPNYAAEEERYRSAISTAAPTVPLAGPDTATKPLDLAAGELYLRDWLFPQWLTPYVRDHYRDAASLDQHFYPLTACLGALDKATTDKLLSRDLAAKTRSIVDAMVAIGRGHQLPVHIDEANNVSCGGEPGVSNTFASALWVVDFLLMTAEAGVSQVNLHGAGGIGCAGYTPACFVNAADRKVGRLTAQPEYYGALLVSAVQGARFLPVRLSGTTNSLVAYALRRGNKLMLVMLNLEPSRASRVSVRLPRAACTATVKRLIAPSVSATTGVRFGGGAVAPSGRFRPGRIDKLSTTPGQLDVAMPATSAALVTVPLLRVGRAMSC